MGCVLRVLLNKDNVFLGYPLAQGMSDSMDRATIQCMIKGDFHSISQYCCVCSMMCVIDNKKKGFVQTLLAESYPGEELGHLHPTELEGWPWAC